MPNLESSSLAGSAPSEQELLETLAEAIGEFERLAAEEPAKFRPANLLTAHQLRWLASALPGLLATARDGERLDWLDTLPCGISILGDATFPHSRGMTPKMPNESHTRLLIDETRKARAAAARLTGSVDNG